MGTFPIRSLAGSFITVVFLLVELPFPLSLIDVFFSTILDHGTRNLLASLRAFTLPSHEPKVTLCAAPNVVLLCPHARPLARPLCILFTAIHKTIRWGICAFVIVGTFWWFKGLAFGIDGPIHEHYGMLWRKVRLVSLFR